MAAQQPTYVDSHVLEELVKDKTKGGHIPGCLNIPAHDLPDQLPQLIEEYKNVPQLFFHCALSQVRGPKAANRWSQALTAAAASNPDAAAPAQKINILRGGFGEWQRKHKDNKVLVEDYQEEYWIEDF
ncbi:hypothetical protein CPB97_003168 [Podila verticillata]|nr:hypothetical protein CPB97_003168 [Podila verticillata]